MEAKLDALAKHPKFDAEFRARLHALLAWRRDVRRFRRDPLPPGTIERLIGIASLAPSVGLSEPWRFIIIDDQRRRTAIRACFEACNADALKRQGPGRASLYARLQLSGLDDAPCQIAVFADRATAQGHGLGRLTMPGALDYSVAIAIHTLWLAARAEGIGASLTSVFLFRLDDVLQILGVPKEDGWQFASCVTFGYPTGRWGVAPRRPVHEVSFRNAWGTPVGFEVPEPLWPAT